MNFPPNFQFSQGSLQDYVNCPRRFQLKYLEKLAWPAIEAEPALENENYLQHGAAFHQLVQQYFLDIPVEKLNSISEQGVNLASWWMNFLHSVENLEDLQKHQDSKYYPEISLTAPEGDFRLVGKFDLLIVKDDKFTIYDWKTSRKQPKREWSMVNLQTRVYPYLLLNAGSYLNHDIPISPSQIKMVYWFANFPKSPQIFHYNEQRYAGDKDFIVDLIGKIREMDDSPAQMTDDKNRCRFCVYRSLCERGIKAGPFIELEDHETTNEFHFDLDFEQISEIEF